MKGYRSVQWVPVQRGFCRPLLIGASRFLIGHNIMKYQKNESSKFEFNFF